MDKIIPYALDRLKEPSTWRGIFLALTVVGLKLEPALQEEILKGGLAIVAIIGILFGDKKEVK